MISILVGVLLGFVMMGLIVWFSMPSMMLKKQRSKLGYNETLTMMSESLQKKGDWHLIKVTDYQESTADYGSLEPICSLSVCNPRYAAKILTEEANRGVTAFMPLAVGVYENKKGEVFISQLNVKPLGMMFGGTIARVMKLAGTDLDNVITSVVSR